MLIKLQNTLKKITLFLPLIILLKKVKPAYAISINVLGELGTGDPGTVLARTLASLWKTAVIAGGISFVLYFVWGALRWMTAESDKGKFESGRQNMTNAIVGLVLLAASVAIIELLGNLLNIDFLKTLSFVFPAA